LDHADRPVRARASPQRRIEFFPQGPNRIGLGSGSFRRWSWRLFRSPRYGSAGPGCRFLTGLAAAVMAWEWGGYAAGVTLARPESCWLRSFWRPSRPPRSPLPGWPSVPPCWVRAGAVAAPLHAGCRAALDGFRRALGGAALHLSLMAGADGPTGRATLPMAAAVVWATDIGAYAVGRTFGGPRFWRPAGARERPGPDWLGARSVPP